VSGLDAHFTVVAKEFRALADLSIQATHQVRAIIDELGTALRDTISLMDRGTHGVSDVLTRLGDSRAPLHELTQLVQQSAAAMQELTRAVGQQHQGIDQIFQATHELLRLTDETLATSRPPSRRRGRATRCQARWGRSPTTTPTGSSPSA